MTVVLTSEMTSKEVVQRLKQLKRKKPGRRKLLDAKRFSGKIMFAGDPVAIQRKMRKEWDRKYAW